MPWRILKQPNGKLARFSTVVDDFTDYNMTEEEAFELCREYLGRIDADQKVARSVENGKRFNKEIETIRRVYGADIAEKRRVNLST